MFANLTLSLVIGQDKIANIAPCNLVIDPSAVMGCECEKVKDFFVEKS